MAPGDDHGRVPCLVEERPHEAGVVLVVEADREVSGDVNGDGHKHLLQRRCHVP
jgi:hypothetical protein